MLDASLLWPSLVTGLTMILYLVLSVNVGRARRKYNVPVPQITGDSNFERVLRVQQNTVEQLVFFLPSLWIFCLWVDPRWGAALGALWILGRILYAWGYYQASEKRIPGFAINSLTTLTLLFGALGKISWLLIRA